jgi:hypothetical protein
MVDGANGGIFFFSERKKKKIQIWKLFAILLVTIAMNIISGHCLNYSDAPIVVKSLRQRASGVKLLHCSNIATLKSMHMANE